MPVQLSAPIPQISLTSSVLAPSHETKHEKNLTSNGTEKPKNTSKFKKQSKNYIRIIKPVPLLLLELWF